MANRFNSIAKTNSRTVATVKITDIPGLSAILAAKVDAAPTSNIVLAASVDLGNNTISTASIATTDENIPNKLYVDGEITTLNDSIAATYLPIPAAGESFQLPILDSTEITALGTSNQPGKIAWNSTLGQLQFWRPNLGFELGNYLTVISEPQLNLQLTSYLTSSLAASTYSPIVKPSIVLIKNTNGLLTNADQVVLWNALDYNIGSCSYDLGVGYIQVPRTGIYSVSYTYNFYGGTSGYRHSAIRVSRVSSGYAAADIGDTARQWGSNTEFSAVIPNNQVIITITCNISLQADDRVYLIVNPGSADVSGGSSVAIWVNNYFSATMI